MIGNLLRSSRSSLLSAEVTESLPMQAFSSLLGIFEPGVVVTPLILAETGGSL